MTSPLSPNTEAILLLTAPLLAGKGQTSSDLLSPGEYNRLARHLQKLNLEPAVLTARDGPEVARRCEQVIEVSRLERLLGRGFLLAQAVERWHARAMWVVSRADPEYPRRLKSRLKADAPAVLYGCGNISSLDSGGLAVVGSRNVDEALVQYTQTIGALAAQAQSAILSGGARGIDQAAMHGALDAGGKATGVLADSLEKAVVSKYNRDMLLAGRLVLTSPYDPAAGFNVGNAMRRNKIVYALADASLVVSSDLNKGGTWTGAVEQLDKLKLVTVFVRSTGPRSAGLDALAARGARPWPNPLSIKGFDSAIRQAAPAVNQSQPQLPLVGVDNDSAAEDPASDVATTVKNAAERTPDSTTRVAAAQSTREPALKLSGSGTRPVTEPVDKLLNAVREIIRDLVKRPMKAEEVAAALEVSTDQATAWLNRMARDGFVEKLSEEALYLPKKSGVRLKTKNE